MGVFLCVIKQAETCKQAVQRVWLLIGLNIKLPFVHKDELWIEAYEDML